MIIQFHWHPKARSANKSTTKNGLYHFFIEKYIAAREKATTQRFDKAVIVEKVVSPNLKLISSKTTKAKTNNLFLLCIVFQKKTKIAMSDKFHIYSKCLKLITHAI